MRGNLAIRNSGDVSDSQSIQHKESRWSSILIGTANKTKGLIIPLIVILGLSFLPKAMAGTVTYASCVKGCTAMGNPIFIAGCIAACTFTLGPWCP